MSKQKTMTIEELMECRLSKARLRQNSPALEKVIEDYAKLMGKDEHVTFPAVTVGTYPKGEGTERLLVDGWLRVAAAEKAGRKTFPVELVEYASELHALADQLKRNHGHGKDVTPGERNKRVQKLDQMGMAQKDIAVLVNLTPASVSRILSGDQGEGNPGDALKGRKYTNRAARGSKKNGVTAESVITVPNFYDGLAKIKPFIVDNMQALQDVAKIEHVGIVQAAIDGLKLLHVGLVKATGAKPSKKAA